MIWVKCPEPGCTHEAELYDLSEVESTHGPVEMGRVQCPTGHRFLMPTEGLVDPAERLLRDIFEEGPPWTG